MFIDLDISILEQLIDFKYTRPIPKTLSIGGYKRLINYNKALNKYINITLI